MKYFYQLKVGEQFEGGDLWDWVKTGMFSARTAHSLLGEMFVLPFRLVKPIEKPNPNCTPENCDCKHLDRKPERLAKKSRV